MILPTRYLGPGQSLIGVAGLVLDEIRRPMTVNRLWEQLRDDPIVGTFDRFVLALDVLFLLGAVRFDDGALRRVR